MIDFSINLNDKDISVSISPDLWLMRQIIDKADELSKYHGREVTDVRIDIEQDYQRVVIDVHKHGSHEFFVGKYGSLLTEAELEEEKLEFARRSRALEDN